MLASRLIRLASDIVNEYERLQVSQLLSKATSVSARRGEVNDQQYRTSAREIRVDAVNLINNSNVQYYPDEMRSLLQASGLSAAMAQRIGHVILAGFPDDRASAMAHNEIGVYTNSVNSALGQLKNLIAAAALLKVLPLEIPEGMISFDVMIPRITVENKVAELLSLFERFVTLASDFIELQSGSRRDPELVYTSTTSPTIGIAVYAGEMWMILQFYKLLLEVVEKQIGIVKTVRDLFSADIGSGLNDALREQVEKRSAELVENAVKLGVEQVNSDLPTGRVNEIAVSIRKQTPHILEAIAGGARLNISIESLGSWNLVTEALPLVTANEISKELGVQARLETSVSQARKLLGESQSRPLLINKDPSDKAA